MSTTEPTSLESTTEPTSLESSVTGATTANTPHTQPTPTVSLPLRDEKPRNGLHATAQATRQAPAGSPVRTVTVTAWRRRRQARELPPRLPPPPDDEKLSNGFHATSGAAAPGSPNAIGGGFAQSQQAGITAMVGLARTEAPPQSLPAVKPPQSQAESPASPPVFAASAASTQLLPVTVQQPVTAQQPVTDRRGLPVRPATLSLLVILTIQAVLSLQLVHSNSAFTDEALYLWAGHLEWAHLLHGTPIPPFPAYFSGAPIIYPPLGALADSVGGLAGARILSLCFMLGATSLLWATASRLYGKRAGFFAAGLWALLGPTLKLGAFATFDPMSLFLVALSAWCAVRGVERRDFTRWIAVSAAALILANAAAYSSAIFDPVVVAITLLTMGHEQAAKLAKMRAAALAAFVISVLILLADAAGGVYWAGISATVLSRVRGTNPALMVLSAAWRWTAPVAVIAAAGLVICVVTKRSRRTRALLAVLAGALLLVPLEQARIHTITSLDKHTDIGAWFAAIAAGYAISALGRLRIPALARVIVTAVCAAALAIPVATGFVQARELFGWPNSQPFVAAFRPLAEHSTGPLLVEAPSPARYYLGSAVPWQRWSSTWAITLPNGRSVGSSNGGVTSAGKPGIYTRRIDDGFFALVALNSTTTPELDRQITEAMVRSHRYRFVESVPYDASYYAGYYAIWERTAATGTR